MTLTDPLTVPDTQKTLHFGVFEVMGPQVGGTYS